MEKHWAHNLSNGAINALARHYEKPGNYVCLMTTRDQILETIPSADKVLNDFITKTVLPCNIRNFGKVKFHEVVNLLDPFDEFEIRYDPRGRKFIFDPYTGEKIKHSR